MNANIKNYVSCGKKHEMKECVKRQLLTNFKNKVCRHYPSKDIESKTKFNNVNRKKIFPNQTLKFPKYFKHILIHVQ